MEENKDINYNESDEEDEIRKKKLKIKYFLTNIIV